MLAMAVATTARVASFDLIVLGSVVRWPGRGPGRPRKPGSARRATSLTMMKSDLMFKIIFLI